MSGRAWQTSRSRRSYNDHETGGGRGHGELTICACGIVLRCVHGIHRGISEVERKDSILGAVRNGGSGGISSDTIQCSVTSSLLVSLARIHLLLASKPSGSEVGAVRLRYSRMLCCDPRASLFGADLRKLACRRDLVTRARH